MIRICVANNLKEETAPNPLTVHFLEYEDVIMRIVIFKSAYKYYGKHSFAGSRNFFKKRKCVKLVISVLL